ncbi:MAG: GntR family transcriptional regulator [Acetobacteraceae bacterium]|nr:GntR family transcriptional regulator [Acetobacteraceae bacterium]
MARIPAEILHRSLARTMLEHLRAEAALPGMRLTEPRLAAALGTSRAPVRGALGVLARHGLAVPAATGRGLVLRRLPPAGEDPFGTELPGDVADQLYWQLAADRLAGSIPDSIAEAELVRRYAVPRGPLRRTMLRVAAEGWAEPGPAGGWRFLPLIDGPAADNEAYVMRRAIEPAALLSPGFSLAPATLARLRAEQQGLSGHAPAPSPRRIFELNAGFHLALVQASGNRFLADAALRLTRLRRLAGYVVALDLRRLETQAREHLAILDRLEMADQAGAAALLVQHLDRGRAARARLLEGAAARLSGFGMRPGTSAGRRSRGT